MDPLVASQRQHTKGLIITRPERLQGREDLATAEGPVHEFPERDARSDEEGGEPWSE